MTALINNVLSASEQSWSIKSVDHSFALLSLPYLSSSVMNLAHQSCTDQECSNCAGAITKYQLIFVLICYLLYNFPWLWWSWHSNDCPTLINNVPTVPELSQLKCISCFCFALLSSISLHDSDDHGTAMSALHWSIIFRLCPSDHKASADLCFALLSPPYLSLTLIILAQQWLSRTDQ